MLSVESEKFLLELRMYLTKYGKKDEDINEVVEELEGHLMEAEKRGKSVESIIGQSPKQYMKSIGEELPMDKRGLLVLIPSSILLLLAYVCYIPALTENFKISKNILLFGSPFIILVLVMYALTVFKGVPKVYPSPKHTFLLLGVASIISIIGWLGFYYWLDSQVDTNYFVATTQQNYMIVALCIFIFIAYSFYTKSWITILVAFAMSIGPIAEKVIPKEINEDPFYIWLTVILCTVIGVVLAVYFFRKSKS
ncbi:NADH dehydrogenase subunit [Bacillus manliponensis]|uniref:NADH dehydrogenase subunit n=1 Tax=Bacillus manliponensis TaxID=574376 RepID=UPI0035184911